MGKVLKLLCEERCDAIARELVAQGSVIASELAARFGVSEATIRRDLRELAGAGLCRKVYGGAVGPAPQVGPIDRRVNTAIAPKVALAAATIRLLKTRQTLFLDAGS